MPKPERVQQEIDNHPTSYNREWSSCFCSHGGRVDWALDAILQEASKEFTLKSSADNVSGFEEPWKSRFDTLPTNATLDADFEMVYVKLLGPGFKRKRVNNQEIASRGQQGWMDEDEDEYEDEF